MKVVKICENEDLSKNLLKSEYVYVLDCFGEIFLWEGSNASPNLKKFGKKVVFVFFFLIFRKLKNYNQIDPILQKQQESLKIVKLFYCNFFLIYFSKEKFIDFPSVLPISVSSDSYNSNKGFIIFIFKI
jgi:hypothetical protein